VKDVHSGTPFWPVRDGLPATYPPLRSDASADVVILGAGVTGALVADALSRAGADVIVIDRADAASGSSAATTGLLLYDTDTSLRALTAVVGPQGAERVYQMGRQAIADIESLVSGLNHPCGFQRRVSLYLASRRWDVRSLREEYAARVACGLQVTWLSRRDVEGSYSFSAAGAIRSDDTAEIDCYRFTHEVLAAAHRRGARIHDRTPVRSIDTRPDGVELTLERGHRVRGRYLVVATGYDIPFTLPMRPGRLASTWAFVSEPLEHFTGWDDRCLIWETARPYLYLRSTDDGRLLAGGEDEPYPFRHRRSRTLEAKTDRLLKRVTKMFPALDIEPAFSWAGTFATTEDGLPYIGRVPQYPRTWFALGYGGNGITFSMIAAHLLRDALQVRPNADAHLFSFDRSETPTDSQ
jgi:glycine/D-amino acid oxidase-like deaminating enzyme